ncbi:MAG TPA: MobF family relaxase, partial [Novosphingobium sp.]|nr:MobF family relaxase [Novosphingobium sp.]
MLSVANVRTASGAANYFAADNYYTRADAERSGQWLGKGAETLGLRGVIEASQFEAVLKGMLPDGSRVGSDNRAHRAGTDLTFSMPKSASILALVSGDRRILDAHLAAVKSTMSQLVEKQFA